MNHLSSLLLLAILLILVGCAVKKPKSEKKTCPDYEFTKTLIAQVN